MPSAVGEGPALPDEIWAQIIEEAYSHDFPTCHTHQFVPDQRAIPISRVSRYFRNLVLTLNLPRLWTCLHITPIASDPRRDQANRVREQLSRSGNLPLTILFACHDTSMDDDPQPSYWSTITTFLNSDEGKHFSSCWDLILPHVQRWQRLAFYAKFPYIVDYFLRRDVFTPRLAMPALGHLDVYIANPASVVNGQFTDIVYQLDLAGLVLPQLRCLRGGGIHWCLSQPSVNSSLTELVLTEIQDRSTLHFSEVLASVSTTLITLVISDVTFDEVVPFVHFPRLRRLVLADVYSDHHTDDPDPTYVVPAVRALLDGAPQLRKLELREFGMADEILLYLAQQSYPSVQSAELMLSDEVECEFMDWFPNLRHLSLPSRDSYELVHKLLERSKIESEEDAPLWPSLEKLSLRSTDVDTSEFAACLDKFLEHRAEIGVPMKTLNLCTGSGMLARVLPSEYLVTLRRQLRVTVSPDDMSKKTKSLLRWSLSNNVPTTPYWFQEQEPVSLFFTAEPLLE